MNTLVMGLIVLLASTLGVSDSTAGGPQCAACLDQWTQEDCEWVLGVGPEVCHALDYEYFDQEWDAYCSNGEHTEWEGRLWFGENLCDETHDFFPDCMGDEDQKDALANAVEAIEKAATFGEASMTLKVLQEIEGVWAEFNPERDAIQILRDGGCDPAPDGLVIEHLLIPKDKIGMWRAVLST